MRRSRAQTAEDNRLAVLTAARRRFELDGFHGASVDTIAEEAGFSKGVVYSQFGSKDDLFLAVLEANIERRHREVERRFQGLDDAGDLSTLVEHNIRENVASAAWQAALIEFRAYAWRRPDLNSRYLALHQTTIDSISGFIAELFRRAGQEPPMPPRTMAVVALAAATGAVLEFMADSGIDFEAIVITLGAAGAARPEPRA